MPIELWDYQEEAVQRMLAEPSNAVLLAGEMGTGKTIMCAEFLARKGSQFNLIIAPTYTLEHWKSAVHHQEARVITSSAASKPAFESLIAGEPGTYIINRELFNSRAKQIAPISSKLDVLVYDECQYWSNRKSKTFANMRLMKPKFRIASSGTPSGNLFSGSWTITRWLWGEVVPRSYWRWAYQWAVVEEKYVGRGKTTTVVAREKNPGEFFSSLPCYIRLKSPVDKPVKLELLVDLTPKERRQYKEFVDYMVTWLGENPLVATLPSVKYSRLRQLVLGTMEMDEESNTPYYPEDTQSAKLDTLLSIIADNPEEPLLVLTHSQKYASVVNKRLQKQGLRSVEWSGAVPSSLRQVYLEDFKAGNIDYIVAVPQSIAEGTDGLQHRCRAAVWLSIPDGNTMLYEQANARIARPGQTRQALVVNILAKDTEDTDGLNNLITKQLERNSELDV